MNPPSDIAPLQPVADDLIRTIDAAYPFLAALNGDVVTRKPAPGKWSKKEIIGHLIDSAANNHHRFVRAQQVEEFVFPKYEQDDWVLLQDYQSAEWGELLDLWRAYNRHLAHVIRRIPQDRLATPCRIGPYDTVPLRFLAEDYVVHLRHHLKQLDVTDEVGAATLQPR